MIDEITRLTNILDKLEKGSGTSMSVLHDECKSILSWVGNVNAAELPDSGEFIAIGLRLGAMAHALTQLFISQTRAVLGPNEAEMSDTSLH